MNLESLASHTIDLDLLPEEPIVLDVGCRWFDFTRAIFEHRPLARVVCMDPARDVVEEALASGLHIRFLPAALTGPGASFRRFAHFSTGEGDFITRPSDNFAGWDKLPDIYEVPCLTVQEVMETLQASQFEVTRFDAVKLDCEGSEFGILENWPARIATQISVEFHDWQEPWRSHGCTRSIANLECWGYRVVQHGLSKQGTGVGHWDSLFVLAK
jgi:FkbM family methyltransferase